MAYDPVGNALCNRVAEDFPAYRVVATDGDRIVARGRSIPFDAERPGREETPAQGWDRVLATVDRGSGDEHPGPTAVFVPDASPRRLLRPC